MPAEMADSSRLSVISELRLSVYGSEIRSRNFQGRRTVTRILPGTQIQSEFQLVVNDLASNIMPKVLLQKSWEQVRHEYSSPVREVKHQILVRCGYCGAVNEESAAKCVSCGGPLKQVRATLPPTSRGPPTPARGTGT